MKSTSENNDSKVDARIQAIFDGAAPRSRAPEAARDEIFAAVHSEWLGVAARRRDRRRLWTGLIAASLVATIALALWLPATQAVGDAVATIDQVHGTVLVASADGEDWRELRAGGQQEIVANARLKVLQGAVGLRLASGAALRLGEQSSARFSGRAAVHLEAGRLYFDSYDGGDAAAVIVETPFGTVRDVGTQFQVLVEDRQLNVTVRSGAASVKPLRSDAQIARSGERLRVDSISTVVREAVPVTGPQWAWAEQLAPAFELDGSNASDFLQWFAHETGHQVRYADNATRQRAESTRLSGGTTRQATREHLDLVLATTVLTATIADSTMLIAFHE